MVVVGSEACFEWLGSCSKLKRGGDELKLVSALSLVCDHDDHSKNKHTSNLGKKHSGFGSESGSQCNGSKPNVMLICVLW